MEKVTNNHIIDICLREITLNQHNDYDLIWLKVGEQSFQCRFAFISMPHWCPFHMYDHHNYKVFSFWLGIEDNTKKPIVLKHDAIIGISERFDWFSEMMTRNWSCSDGILTYIQIPCVCVYSSIRVGVFVCKMVNHLIDSLKYD